ncbi:3'-5' exonuclease [Colletotrichum karsti]|uniref:3'-5' exonuclease n=1 Tax=Colletotrichum karsti TaxID=1095194 RepID=A0A9P6HVV7_9PEZI|nr:3'-5' exonuclease [Colletotrichum karsti]KAF9869831.1 3'-5' exonuclease [Colletotrichum karsti]
MRGNMYRRNHHWRRPELEESSPAPPFGRLIESVTIADLGIRAKAYVSSARITGCELVASYNWLDEGSPTIMVPGAPARWTPLADPVRLREDDGVYYRDKNAARYPDHPMEPAVQAVLEMHPRPFGKQVDIVACGSTLGNLLRFVRGDERPFRMLVWRVGSVVHLIRRENSPKETIPNVKGYGHTFPEAYTTWDSGVRNSASHQRILRYDFGGLGCLVRHEGDGYLKEKVGRMPEQPKQPSKGSRGSVDELIASFGGNKMSSAALNGSSRLNIQPGGFEVPQTAIFDLKTRSIMRKGQDFLGEEIPRMWVAQIPNFVLAYHNRGTFNDIEVLDVSAKMAQWEEEKNKELSQLAALLHLIIDLALSRADQKMEISLQVPVPNEFRAPQQNPYGAPSIAISPTPAYLKQLRSMTHHRDILAKSGFVIAQLSHAEFDRKRRCQRCNVRCNNGGNRGKPDAREGRNGNKKPFQKSPAPKAQRQGVPIPGVDGPDKARDDKDDKPRLKCQYHTGHVVRMHWNCCRNFVSAPGCTFAPEHLTRVYSPQELQIRYQFHKTPVAQLFDFNPAPLISFSSVDSYTPSGSRETRQAVALDCEMGVAFDGESELIRLTMIDYFTSEILLDSLISPAVPMQNYNARYSGISRQDMDEARRKGKCVHGGYAAAREAVWRWVGPDTVVVGHAVHNDLASLRWIHPLVVDSLVLATAAKAEKDKREAEEEEARKEAEEEQQIIEALHAAARARATGEDIEDLMSFDDEQKTKEQKKKDEEEKKAKKQKGGGLSLKKLTKELLGRDIQMGKTGHDSLEDAVAARDLVHWYVMRKTEELLGKNENDTVPGFW